MLNDLYSSALTDLLFEKSDDFIGIYDLTDEQFVRVNQAGVRLLGFDTERALLADPVRSRSVRAEPLADEHRMSLIARIIQAGQHEETTQIGRQDGHTFWGQAIFSAFTADSKPYALVRLIDQGRLHQTERDLDHSVRRYEAIFSYATIGIVVCNQPGEVMSANHLATELFGYEAGGLIGLSIEELVPMDVSHYHKQLRESFNRNPQVREMGRNRDLHARRKDGSVFPIEISLSHFRLEEELYAVAYIVDITVKKAAERQLLTHRDAIQRLNADLEQKVADRTNALMNTLDQLKQSKDELTKALAAEQRLGELKSRFVSMASHEFRTPLTVLQTSATLIGKYIGINQPDKCDKHLSRIHSSVNHLNDTLEEFLSVGKLEEGKVDTHPAEVDVAALVAETVTDAEGMLKPGQRIVVDVVAPGPVWLDPSLLRKILVNLLSNAVKYSGSGCGQSESVVTVCGTCVGNKLTLIITDQGVGIPKDDQAHLFERFFRATNSTNVPGTGLGLHIVGRYVELMGGQVSLMSELNEGTRVTLTLPYENHSAD